MENRTIKLIIVLSVVSILGILVSQAYWIKKAIEIQDSEFNTRVSSALKIVTKDILMYNQNPSPLIDPVVKVSVYDFAVKVNDRIQPALLEGLLKKEFLIAGIKDDYLYRIYDCFGKTVVNERLISQKAYPTETILYTKFPHDNYFFYLKFPFKRQLWDNIHLWLFSTLVLTVVMIFLAYLLYAVFRQKMLAQVQKDFINNMTHEFKTPITSIALASELLQSDSSQFSYPKILSYAKIINKEVSKLENQVERILQMSEMSRQGIKIKKECIEVHPEILKIVTKFQLLNSEVAFDVDLSVSNTKIFADPLHFCNILENLLDNAIKYSTNNKPTVTIRTYNDRNTFYTSIQDNGIGIERKYQKKIFDNFYRIVKGDVQNIKGFGVGLYYVKLLTKIHNAHVSVSSTPGVGSNFTISFPSI